MRRRGCQEGHSTCTRARHARGSRPSPAPLSAVRAQEVAPAASSRDPPEQMHNAHSSISLSAGVASGPSFPASGPPEVPDFTFQPPPHAPDTAAAAASASQPPAATATPPSSPSAAYPYASVPVLSGHSPDLPPAVMPSPAATTATAQVASSATAPAAAVSSEQAPAVFNPPSGPPAAAGSEELVANPTFREVWVDVTGARPNRNALQDFYKVPQRKEWWAQVRAPHSGPHMSSSQPSCHAGGPLFTLLSLWPSDACSLAGSCEAWA